MRKYQIGGAVQPLTTLPNPQSLLETHHTSDASGLGGSDAQFSDHYYSSDTGRFSRTT